MMPGNESRPNAPRLAIVVPCHDEEETLPETLRVLGALLESLQRERLVAANSYVACVDDGSRDRTWALIRAAAERSPHVRGLKLTRNFGQQGAMLAGLLEHDADAYVTIDADLQDDENRIRDMLACHRDGYDVVYGVRGARVRDSWVKRNFALAFYRVSSLVGARVVHNHADFRLMSRAAVDRLREFRESNLFLRGLVPLVGLPSTTVKYDRRARHAGVTKYGPVKLFGLAWEAITSLSVMPLRLVSTIGAIVAVVAVALACWAFYERLFGAGSAPGWASTVLPIYLLGGLQILCMGIIGEYVGKIYMETKKRPRYLVGQRAEQERRTRAEVVPIVERRRGDRRRGDRRGAVGWVRSAE